LVTLLAEQLCLHCRSSKETDVIKVKLWTRDHSSTNSMHECAGGSVTNLKMCYGESADNFWLPTYLGESLFLCIPKFNFIHRFFQIVYLLLLDYVLILDMNIFALFHVGWCHAKLDAEWEITLCFTLV
jgi:hypothetical protein